MMPVSESGNELSQRPVSVAIKQALENTEASKLQKEDILREKVLSPANLTLIEELMAVHQGQKSKDDVFTANKNEYNEKFSKIAE
jgi:hypothetical protein